LVDRADPRIDGCSVELREHEDLGRRVDTGADRGDVPDAVRRLELGAPLAEPVPIGARVKHLASAVVQPVLPRCPAVPRLELPSFGIEIAVTSTDPVDNLVLDP